MGVGGENVWDLTGHCMDFGFGDREPLKDLGHSD